MERFEVPKKCPPIQGKLNRVKVANKVRTSNRFKLLDTFRNIENTPVVPSKKEAKPEKSMNDKLKEWKALKIKRLEEEKKKKKPAFVAGKVQYSANGNLPLTNIINVKKSNNYMKTRSQTKYLSTVEKNLKEKEQNIYTFKQLNKMEDDNQFCPVKKHEFAVPKKVTDIRTALTIPLSPKLSQRIQKSSMNVDSSKSSSNIVNENLPKGSQRNLLAQSGESSGLSKASTILVDELENVRDKGIGAGDSTTNSDISLVKKSLNMSVMLNYSAESSSEDYKKRRIFLESERIAYSPNVEKVRGAKRLSSRETLEKIIDNEIILEEGFIKSDIAHFRLFLLNETERLQELADKWKIIAESEEIPPEAIGEIDAAKGKTTLLTTDKFKQFENLIDKFEAKDPNIRIDDLKGFRDWVTLEVEDLNKIFKQLEDKRNKNWSSPKKETPVKDEKSKPKRIRKPVPRKGGVMTALRAHINAARKKMRGSPSTSDSNVGLAVPLIVITPDEESVTPTSSLERNEKSAKSLESSIFATPTGNFMDSKESSDVTSKIMSPRSNCVSVKVANTETPKHVEQSLLRKSLNRQISALEVMAVSAKAKTLTPGKPRRRSLTLYPVDAVPHASSGNVDTNFSEQSYYTDEEYIAQDPSSYIQPKKGILRSTSRFGREVSPSSGGDARVTNSDQHGTVSKRQRSLSTPRPEEKARYRLEPHRHPTISKERRRRNSNSPITTNSETSKFNPRLIYHVSIGLAIIVCYMVTTLILLL